MKFPSVTASLFCLTPKVTACLAILLTTAPASAGVMNAGVPDETHARLELWLDAGALPGDTTSVSSWPDSSAYSRNATQGTVSSQPTYTASNPLFANRPTVHFDGGDLLISATPSTMNVNGALPRTVFVVFSQDALASKNVVGFGANATGQLFDVLLFNVLPAGLPPEPRFTGHFHGGGNDTIGATTRFFSANDVTVGTISYDGAAVRTYQHNAAASGLLVAKSIALNTGDGAFRVGGGVYPNYNLFVGHIAEVLVYSEVLSDADREAVEAYLFTKYTVVTVDTDGDGVADDVDNCVDDANPAQANNDGDAEGDVCDLDDDNDGTVDTADNCPVDANFDQADFDGDGLGNVCDPTFVAGETVAEIEGLSKVIRDAVAAANPPGGNGMVAKILGKGGVLAKVSNAVDRFNFGLIDAATYVAELQDALDKLDAFDNQLAAKIGNGQIADPEATALEDASVAIRAIIDDLIFNAGF